MTTMTASTADDRPKPLPTPEALAILRRIVAYRETTGTEPRLADLGHPSTVSFHVNKLRALGYLEANTEGRQRALTPTAEGNALATANSHPPAQDATP
jgi:DNA-binding transcriptional ArsR family regulator